MRQNGFFRLLAEQSDNQKGTSSLGFDYWAYRECQPFGFHVTMIMHNFNFVNSFFQKKIDALLESPINRERGCTVPVSYQAFYAYMPERVHHSQRRTRSGCFSLYISFFIDSDLRDRTCSGPASALLLIICTSLISPSKGDRVAPGPSFAHCINIFNSFPISANRRDRVAPGPFILFLFALFTLHLHFVFSAVPGNGLRGPLFFYDDFTQLPWVKINCGPDGTLILQTCCPVPSALSSPPSITCHPGAQRPASLSPIFFARNQKTKKALKNIKNNRR